jgi:hypothetical protein
MELELKKEHDEDDANVSEEGDGQLHGFRNDT